MNANQFEIQLEIVELKDIGLSEEEIEGYFEFFAENYEEDWTVPHYSTRN